MKKPLHNVNDFINIIYKNDKNKKIKSLLEIKKYIKMCRSQNGNKMWGDFYKNAENGVYIHKKLGDHLRSRQGDLCCYCRTRIIIKKGGNIEHILPASTYRKHTFNFHNMAFACITCNSIKSDDDWYKEKNKTSPYKNIVFRCFHPNFDVYQDHIEFLALQTNAINFRFYYGKTYKGKVLCKKLLNGASCILLKNQGQPKLWKSVNDIEDIKEKLNIATPELERFKKKLINKMKNIK